MGLLEQEIKELREMNRQLAKGTITPEHVSARIAIYSQTEKRAKLMLHAHGLAAKHGKKVLSTLERTNLIGEGASIDMREDAEAEAVRCLGSETHIARHECLDISGGQKAFEECEVCEHFAVTRQKLLPEEQ